MILIMFSGAENIDGKECWKIRGNTQNDNVVNENGFSCRVSYIEKNIHLMVRSEFYNKAVLNKVQTCRITRKQPNGSILPTACPWRIS